MKAVVFDFDGTLADSLSVMLKVYNNMAVQRNLRQVTNKDWEHLRRMNWVQGIRYAGVKPYQVPGLLAIGRREFMKHTDEIAIFPGVAEAVRALAHHYQLFVLSTNSPEAVRQVLDKYQLTEHMTLLKRTSLFGKFQAIRKLLKQLKLAPDDLWVVGDELRDIQAAKKAGVPVIAVEWGLQSKDVLEAAGPTALAKTPDDILKVLNVHKS